MSIFKNLHKAHVAIEEDLVNATDVKPPTLGKKYSVAAVAAITKGMGSQEWKDYMSLFADNAAQLARLTTVAAGGEPDYLPLFRAYIVSNSVCDITTNTNTINRVTRAIDDGIADEQPDGTIVRPPGF